MSDIQSVRKHVKALENALNESEKQVKILKECLRLECQIQDQATETPEGYPLAISYRPVGEGFRFLVLGHDQKSIEEMAQFYAKTCYKGAAVEPIKRDQSFVRQVVKNQSGYEWLCVGINPFSGYYCQRPGDQIATTLEDISIVSFEDSLKDLI